MIAPAVLYGSIIIGQVKAMRLCGKLRRCFPWAYVFRRSFCCTAIGPVLVTCLLLISFILPGILDRTNIHLIHWKKQTHSNTDTQSDLMLRGYRATNTGINPEYKPESTALSEEYRVGDTTARHIISSNSTTLIAQDSREGEVPQLVSSKKSEVRKVNFLCKDKKPGFMTPRYLLEYDHELNSEWHTVSHFRINERTTERLTYYAIPVLAERHVHRMRKVADYCHEHQKELHGLYSVEWVSDRIEVIKDRHLLYCRVLKVGSTFWERVTYAIRNNKTINTPFDVTINEALKAKRNMLKELLPLNKPSTRDFLRKSVNMMFVREPFSRLLSGYNDKLFAPNPYFWTHIGKFIIQKYRRNASEKSLKCGHDVTFPEFVKYVIDSEIKIGSKRDEHFTPSFDFCKPCRIHYNVIGKMETFKEDAAYFFHTLGFNLSVNTLNLWAEKAEEDAVMDSTFSPFGWRKQIERCMPFYDAAKRIWHKMQIRGIVRKDRQMPFSEQDMHTVSSNQFIYTLLKGRGIKNEKSFLKKQKHEALQGAYNLVTEEDIEKLRTIFKPDFELFGYDLHPKHIFSSQNPTESAWVFNISSI